MLRIRSLFRAAFATTILCASATAHADEVYWIDPSLAPQLTKCDLKNGGALTVVAVGDLASGERVTGMTTPYPGMLTLPPAPKADARLLIETEDLEYRTANLNFTSGKVTKSTVLKEGAYIYPAKGLVTRSFGLFSVFPGNSGQVEYNLIVNEYGDFIKPGGVKNSFGAATKSVGTMTFLDSIISIGKSPKGPIMVLTEGTKDQLHFFHYSTSPGIEISLKKSVVVDVKCPNANSWIIGFTMSDDKQVYALVNHMIGLSGHTWGDFLLCRGAIANQKLQLTQLAKIGSWGGGLPYTGPYQMIVKKT